jgi:hypothetical protein
VGIKGSIQDAFRTKLQEKTTPIRILKTKPIPREKKGPNLTRQKQRIAAETRDQNRTYRSATVLITLPERRLLARMADASISVNS